MKNKKRKTQTKRRYGLAYTEYRSMYHDLLLTKYDIESIVATQKSERDWVVHTINIRFDDDTYNN